MNGWLSCLTSVNGMRRGGGEWLSKPLALCLVEIMREWHLVFPHKRTAFELWDVC